MYPRRVWSMPSAEKILYLTFDDGPHPTATSFVLDQLKLFDAKATFFCIGKNVEHHPEIYQSILREGHNTGNHTQHHLNGWKTPLNEYLSDVKKASATIKSNLFRPPYGRLTSKQAKQILKNDDTNRIIMWDVLSGDFDEGVTGEYCFNKVKDHAVNGSIVVFHDSEKAWPRLQVALPKVLHYFSGQGYEFRVLQTASRAEVFTVE